MKLGLTPWNFSDLTASSLSEQANFGESLGYESFFLPENHFNEHAIPDPLMLLAGVAAATTRMQLATTSFLLPLRNPLLAAEQVAVLDQLSGGRVILGVGRGYSNEMLKAFSISPRDKRRHFETTLELMRRAWSGEPVSIDGDEDAAVVVKPSPLQKPHPPIWVAAFGPKALAQSGRLGLPYLASPIESFATLASNQQAHEAALAEANHPPPTTRPIMRTVFCSDKASEIETIRDRMANAVLPTGRKADPAIDDWAVIGDRGFVDDALARIRETFQATHLVVTRLRIDGVDDAALRRSLELIRAMM